MTRTRPSRISHLRLAAVLVLPTLLLLAVSIWAVGLQPHGAATPGQADLAVHVPSRVAPGHPPAGPQEYDLALATSVGQLLDNIRNTAVGFLAGLATVFLTIGGLRYMLAGGDPSEVGRARATIRGAAIGYGLAILAPLIVQLLKAIVGA